ncbi:MAG: hypothetical protein J1E31_06945 [Helicobacter sp.]|nr:hypothetical protein [Helicobacter sp.]
MQIKIIKTGKGRVFNPQTISLKFKTNGELLVVTIISNEYLRIKEKDIPKNLRFTCKKTDEESIKNFLKGAGGDNVLKIEKDYNLVFSFDENL